MNSRKERKRGSFATMSNLMNKLVVNLGLDQRLKEHALLNLWPTLAGEVFADKSRCLFIDNERKLVISVKDASVGQELSLLRRELLKKLQTAGNGLGVKIEGIRFDLKHFYQRQEDYGANASYEKTLPKHTAADLQSVVLSKEDLEQISLFKQDSELEISERGHDFASELQLSRRTAAILENELRLKIWRRTNGYPLCPSCQEPADQLHGNARVCAHCFYESMYKPYKPE